MTKPNGTPLKTSQSKELAAIKEAGHKRVMEYFRVGEDSKHSELRLAAIQMAIEEAKHYRRQEARVSPTLAVTIICTAVMIAGVVSIYAFLERPPHIAFEVSGCSVALVIVIVAAVGLFTGYLSQDNFMRLINTAWSWFKNLRSGMPSPSLDGANSPSESKPQNKT